MTVSGTVWLCLALGVGGLQACSSGSDEKNPPDISVVDIGPTTTGAVDNGVNEGSFPIQPTSGTEP